MHKTSSRSQRYQHMNRELASIKKRERETKQRKEGEGKDNW